MTKDQLAAFLTGAGVAFSLPGEHDPSAVDFKNRGTSMRAIAYEDGDLLHLTCTYAIPPHCTLEKIHEIFASMQDEFPIVKLNRFESEGHAGFTVSAEQFEPDLLHIGSVFWRTADLLVTVADECHRRLEAPPVGVSTNEIADKDQWVVELEAALRQGSDRPGAKAREGESAGVYAGVKASLALVVMEDCSTGTAFCIASDEHASYYVTNGHVVGGAATVPLYRQRPQFDKLEAKVIARGEDEIDLALLRVDAPNIAQLNLQDHPPKSESEVALAGYARVHIWAAEQFGELVPSIRHGTVTGILKSGSCVLHDVLCRPGDSGGPLFDPLSGTIVGVQTAGWHDEEEGYAIGVPMLAEFLRSHKLLAV
jgi:Trypsin-like peptidase domain